MSLFVSLSATCPILCESTLFSVLFKVTAGSYIHQLSLCFLSPISYPTTPSLFKTTLSCTGPSYVLYYSVFPFLSITVFSTLLYLIPPHLPKGPFFRFQTYFDWLRQPNPQILPGWVPCLQRLKLVPVYGALFLAVNSVFPLAYVRTEEFLDQNFFFRYTALLQYRYCIISNYCR